MTDTSENVSAYARIRFDADETATPDISTVPDAPGKVRAKNLEFNLDHAFDTKVPQQQLYDIAAKGIVQRVIDGFNAAILAYGQTGSGKSALTPAHSAHAVRSCFGTPCLAPPELPPSDACAAAAVPSDVARALCGGSLHDDWSRGLPARERGPHPRHRAAGVPAAPLRLAGWLFSQCGVHGSVQ